MKQDVLVLVQVFVQHSQYDLHTAHGTYQTFFRFGTPGVKPGVDVLQELVDGLQVETIGGAGATDRGAEFGLH